MRAREAFKRNLRGSPYGSDLDERHGNNRNDKSVVMDNLEANREARKEAERKESTNDRKDKQERSEKPKLGQ